MPLATAEAQFLLICKSKSTCRTELCRYLRGDIMVYNGCTGAWMAGPLPVCGTPAGVSEMAESPLITENGNFHLAKTNSVFSVVYSEGQTK